MVTLDLEKLKHLLKLDDIEPSGSLVCYDTLLKCFIDKMKREATEAGWRLAGKQLLKLTREPIVAFLSRQLGGDESTRTKVAVFLDTDFGEVLLASVLSVGLAMLPGTTGEIPKRLSKELRVQAMTDVGDVVSDLLMGPLREVAVMYLQNVNPSTTRQESAHRPSNTPTTLDESTSTTAHNEQHPAICKV